MGTLLGFKRLLFYPVKIVRVYPDDNQPWRDPATGRCVLCPPGEAGLLLGEIDPRRADRRFDGYSDEAATRAKVLRGVLREGDSYFNSGDLISRDRLGFFFWGDRTGDTFRWKGENVSTQQVEQAVLEWGAVEDCVAYGVAVPGCDGRAKMVSANREGVQRRGEWGGGRG